MSKYSDITDTQRWFSEPSGRETKSDGAYLMQRSLVDTNSCRDTEHRVRNICIRTLSGPNICLHVWPNPALARYYANVFLQTPGGQNAGTKVRESIPSTRSDVASWKSWVSRLSECQMSKWSMRHYRAEKGSISEGQDPTPDISVIYSWSYMWLYYTTPH